MQPMRKAISLLVGIVAFVGVNAQVFRIAGPSRQPEAHASWMAGWIWNSDRRTTKERAIMASLDDALLRHEWRKALSFARQLRKHVPSNISKWEDDIPYAFDSAIGELLLFQLRYSDAEAEFRRVLNTVPVSHEFGRSLARRWAARGMSLICAERGDFKSALTWEEDAQAEYLYRDWRDIPGPYARKVIWGAAQLPSDLAVKSLSEIVKGNFEPAHEFNPAPGIDYLKEGKDQAKAIALLALAELYLRRGDNVRAREYFEIASFTPTQDHEINWMAETHVVKLMTREAGSRGWASSAPRIGAKPRSAKLEKGR